MGQSSPEELLKAFRRKGGGWTYAEAVDLLQAHGFVERKTSRGHAVWTCGKVILTLTQERLLKRPYVSLILRSIERAQEDDL
jgi:hypothetical protein